MQVSFKKKTKTKNKTFKRGDIVNVFGINWSSSEDKNSRDFYFYLEDGEKISIDSIKLVKE